MLPFLIVDTALYLPDLDVARYTTYPLAPLTFFHFSVACFLPAVTVTAGVFGFTVCAGVGVGAIPLVVTEKFLS